MRMLATFVLLAATSLTALAQDELWKGEAVDLRLGLNNGLPKIFVRLTAKPDAVPLLQVRFRRIDQEGLKKDLYTDFVIAGKYVYRGKKRVREDGNDWLEHRFEMSGNKTFRLMVDVKALAPKLLASMRKDGFLVQADDLPPAMLVMKSPGATGHYPLRDISAFKGREERALILNHVPMEEGINRQPSVRLALFRLKSLDKRAERLEVLRGIETSFSNEDLDAHLALLLRLREDPDVEFGKAVRAFCVSRGIYSLQEVMQHLYLLRQDDAKGWKRCLDFLDKTPDRDSSIQAAPDLRWFLDNKSPDEKLRMRAEAKLADYRKILPPGYEKNELPAPDPEKGYLRPIPDDWLLGPEELKRWREKAKKAEEEDANAPVKEPSGEEDGGDAENPKEPARKKD